MRPSTADQPITVPQLKTIHTLLGKSGITDKHDKKVLIRNWSNNRTESSKELTKGEAEALISNLMGTKSVNPATDKMRKKLLAMAHEMAWKLPNGSIDMKRVNNWCIQYGYGHKKLDDYTYAELPKLIGQFEEVYRDYISKVERS